MDFSCALPFPELPSTGLDDADAWDESAAYAPGTVLIRFAALVGRHDYVDQKQNGVLSCWSCLVLRELLSRRTVGDLSPQTAKVHLLVWPPALFDWARCTASFALSPNISKNSDTALQTRSALLRNRLAMMTFGELPVPSGVASRYTYAAMLSAAKIAQAWSGAQVDDDDEDFCGRVCPERGSSAKAVESQVEISSPGNSVYVFNC